MIKTVQIIFILLLTASWAIQASELQSHAEIRNAVTEFLASKTRQLSNETEIEAHPLDHRLRLSKCATPVKVFLLPGSRLKGRVSVGVRCEDSNQPWKIYSSATIKVFTNVVTLNKSLARGAEISPNDLMLIKMDVSNLRSGYFTNPKEAVGKKLKRVSQKGTLLNHRLLLIPKMIKRGNQVIILAQSGQLSIRMAGKALSDGAKGDVIRVQNIKSGRIIQAKVISEGIVQTSFNR